jgi:hypothetical protein
MTPRRTVVAARSLDDLMDTIHRTLCEQDRLDPDQAPIRHSPIRKAGRVCGLLYVVHGPRRLRCQAIWASEENRVLCYDSAGVRFAELELCESPEPLTGR